MALYCSLFYRERPLVDLEKMAEKIVAEDPLLEPVWCECLGRRGEIRKDVEESAQDLQRDLYCSLLDLNRGRAPSHWGSDLASYFIKSADQWRRTERPAERHNAQHFLDWRAKQCGFGEEADQPLVTQHIFDSLYGSSPEPTSGPYVLAKYKVAVTRALAWILGAAALGPLLPFVLTHILPGVIVFFPVATLPALLFCCMNGCCVLLSPELLTSPGISAFAPIWGALCGAVFSLWIQQTTTMVTFLYEGEGWGGAVWDTFSDRRATDYVANLGHAGIHAVQSQYDAVAQLIAQGS
jgi:hypothetical protein